MNSPEFFERLYALNREGRCEELLEFADAHAKELMPHFTGEEIMRMYGLTEGAAMTLSLEEYFGPARESEPATIDIPSSLDDA